MRRFLPQVAWICMLVLLLCLSIRLLWIASQLETGLPTLAIDWRNSTLTWLVRSYIPVPERPPTEQAEFWLAETDRILREHPNDARLTMAAALILDSPGTSFIRSHLQAIRTVSGLTFPERDREAIQRAENEFEQHCQSRCLELAAKATELDSENLDWWRLRAILLFRRGGTSPRDEQWVRMLDDFH